MKQSFSVILSFFLLLVASKKANSQDVVELVDFNFESFSNANPLLQFQGDATVLLDGNIVLTDPTSPASIGRVLYAPGMRLWDTASGRTANFTTSFTFQVIDYQDFIPAEGIIFFIAPEDTQIPAGGGGGALGVANATGVGNFVGVEFDNHFNPEFGDLPLSHVAIDANYVFSLKTVRWNSVSGSVVDVTVRFDPSSNTLSASLRNRGDTEIVTISQVINLKQYLPPNVKFGFSAAASVGGRQVHVIRSWSFSSRLQLQTTSDVATA